MFGKSTSKEQQKAEATALDKAEGSNGNQGPVREKGVEHLG